MDKGLLIAIGISELISVLLILRILSSTMSGAMKTFSSLIALVPIIGPAMYLFAFQAPAVNRYKHRRHALRNIGSYEGDFDQDTKSVKKRIEKIKNRAKDESE